MSRRSARAKKPWHVAVRCWNGQLTAAEYITTEQLLLEEPSVLAAKLHLGAAQACALRDAVERACAPQAVSAWKILRKEEVWVHGTPREDEVVRGGSPVHLGGSAPAPPQTPTPSADALSTGDAQLDHCLGGGLPRGMLTEIAGESASGKTQFVLFTAACVALGLVSDGDDSASFLQDGRGHYVAVVCTSGRSNARHMVDRLLQMGESLLQERVADSPAKEATIERGLQVLLGNVSIACAATFDDVEHVLCYTLPGLIARADALERDIALVALDSVPPLLQEDALDVDSAPAGVAPHTWKAAKLQSLAAWLKRIAICGGPRSQRRAVVVVNHMSDAFANDKALVHGALALDQGMPAEESSVLPLQYAPQAAHFSGLLGSLPSHESTGGAPARVPPHRFSMEDDLKTAQLGLVWANSINARCLITNIGARGEHGAIRRFRVLFSPMAAPGSEVYYSIHKRGIAAG